MAEKVAGELYESITGQLFEIGRQLRQSKGYPFDPRALQESLQRAIEGKFESSERSTPYLRYLTATIIVATDGTETIAGARSVFTDWVDPNFNIWGTNKPGKKTKKTGATVMEMQKSATPQQIFGTTEAEWRPKVWEQSQIVAFCRDHQQLLHPNVRQTFFLFEVDGVPFVASVHKVVSRLHVSVRYLGITYVWNGACRYRVILPQRTLAA